MQKAQQTILPHKKLYFAGIGGIGISALARLAVAKKAEVWGSDHSASDSTDDLKKLGVHFTLNQKSLPKRPFDAFIYSNALDFNHPLFCEARKRTITTKSYPEILGELSSQYTTIAISGTHGKSTTTAMIGIMLESAGLDPLVIVGTKVPQWKGNIRISKTQNFRQRRTSLWLAKLKISARGGPAFGWQNYNLKLKTKKNIFVVEADEYKSAMLNLEPDMIVLTRVEEDHLDYYRNLAHIKREFQKFVHTVPKNGAVIANEKDKNIQEIVAQLPSTMIPYNTESDQAILDTIKKILHVPGRHNRENALAAYKVGKFLGLTEKQALTGLSKFRGTWRRLEQVGKLEIRNLKLEIISDYAHHPTEIKASLQALKEQYPKKRVILAFQPHQHNRTKKLFKEFLASFDSADILIVNEIYSVLGRERKKDENISSQDLVHALIKNNRLRTKENTFYTKNLQETKKMILKTIDDMDVVVIMGAGDIDRVARELTRSKA